MPAFDTPEPISATVEVVAGNIRFTAADRADTVVEVRPAKSSRDSDVQAAELTRVEYANGRLHVKAPKPRGLFGRGGSVDVTVELPAGSRVDGRAAVGDLRCDGPLGDCRLVTGSGDIEVDQAGSVRLKTAHGDVTVDRAEGHCEVTGSGAVNIRKIDGAAVVKNLNGDIWVGEVTGELRSSTANGDITVDKAQAGVGAKTANGNIRVGEVVRDSVQLATAYGEVEIGIREGTAAWLDVGSSYGTVHNSLEGTDGPERSDNKVKVRARTAYGDIVIRRS
ncbi:DUF4097 family beta strand repeat-containing protein [Pseudonocardia acaciae]|uniref:DUF4097 family beta strand repeat-containing protein n=1 Tax=Pseudonocardia acaciae TaxID=551276 RepID=UPI00048B539B|nr:DUF4097 family beta strand repeat-containing protein [Pseudonocardia acaciae]